MPRRKLVEEPVLRFEDRDIGTAIVCPLCEAPLPRKRSREIWVEVPNQSGWVAAYRIVARNQSPIVAEVRLFPNEPDRPGGAWSEKAARVPAGGLPGRAIATLRLREPVQLFPRIVDNWDKKTKGYIRAEVLKRFGITKTGVVTHRPGRGGRSDLFYATWAAAYVARLDAGSRTPVKDLSLHPPVAIEGYVSNDLKASPETVGDIIGEARRRGLLTAAPPGRAGGELTKRARRLLRRS